TGIGGYAPQIVRERCLLVERAGARAKLSAEIREPGELDHSKIIIRILDLSSAAALLSIYAWPPCPLRRDLARGGDRRRTSPQRIRRGRTVRRGRSDRRRARRHLGRPRRRRAALGRGAASRRRADRRRWLRAVAAALVRGPAGECQH